MDEHTRIRRIEVGTLWGTRPRAAGTNSRVGPIGDRVEIPLARLTTDDGVSGFGISRITRAQAEMLLGVPVHELFAAPQGVVGAGFLCDFPLWDLAGMYARQPVYALAATMAGSAALDTLRVPCYDTTLYFDDTHLADDAAGAALIAAEAQAGYARGHRAFKLKIGRGARYLPLDVGTRRDIAVIRAVREAVGPECALMLDANDGYNLNLTKQVLTETAACGVFWMEEPFREDPALYAELRAWLNAQGSAVLIADGEGEASAHLLTWARDGVVDVIQYDIFSHGFTRWLATGRQLDGWGRRTAPHHYGRCLGNYVSGHLASVVQGYTYVEWDEATVSELDATAYVIQEGHVALPNLPGFGLALDEAGFRRTVAETGFTLDAE